MVKYSPTILASEEKDTNTLSRYVDAAAIVLG